MSDDLVKRLRSPEVFLMTSAMISPVAYEAADRIEQLEAALRDIADDCEAEYPPSHGAIKHAARKALEGKDER